MTTFWTKQRSKKCADLWAEGKSFTRIAVELDATRDMVASKVRRTGLSRSSAEPQTPWTGRELAILTTARGEGATFPEIALLLPRRSANQCKAMASYRGIRKGARPTPLTPKGAVLVGDDLYVAECLAHGGFPLLRLAA